MPSASSPCATNQVVVDANRGSPTTSNDNPASPNDALVEQYAMGLLSDTELRASNQYITYCPLASRNAFTWARPTFTLDCVGGLQFITMDQVIAAKASRCGPSYVTSPKSSKICCSSGVNSSVVAMDDASWKHEV